MPYAVALLLGTVIAWWIGSTVLYRTLEERVLQQLEQAAEVISQPNFPVTEAVLARLDKLMGFSIYIFDRDGKLEFDPPPGGTRRNCWRAAEGVTDLEGRGH